MIFPPQKSGQVVRHGLKTSLDLVVSVLTFEITKAGTLHQGRLSTQAMEKIISCRVYRSEDIAAESRKEITDSGSLLELAHSLAEIHPFGDTFSDLLLNSDYAPKFSIKFDPSTKCYLKEEDNTTTDCIMIGAIDKWWNRYCTGDKAYIAECRSWLWRLLEANILLLWDKFHDKIDDRLWSYWYRVLISAAACCVILDAYHRKCTSESGIKHLLSRDHKFNHYAISITISEPEEEISIPEKSIEEKLIQQETIEEKPIQQEDIETAICSLQVIYDPESYDVEASELMRSLSISATTKIVTIAMEQASNNCSLANKTYIIKCALGFQINENAADDCRDDSLARILMLHVFNLDIRDVAKAIDQQAEISWSGKRINRASIVTLLLSAESGHHRNNNDTHNLADHKVVNEDWTLEDDMAAIYALENFNLALGDLEKYFQYDSNIKSVLKLYSIEDKSSPVLDSSSDFSEDPTYSIEKHWKEIKRHCGAKDALKKYHDTSGKPWEVTSVPGTRTSLATLGFGKKTKGRIATVPNDDNTHRVIAHVGNHNSYETYRKKTHT
ncbi:unnamed protein product, partial [Rotaria magnacalcarata]